MYVSQYKQDAYLDLNVFNKKEGGVFIDVGAYDGKTISNSWFFEKHRGWTGICVEPIKEQFDLLEQNRDCVCEHCAVGEKTGEAMFLHVEGYAEMLSGLVDSYCESHHQRLESELHLNGGAKNLLPIQTITITDLLEKHNISHVDFISIDTEGGELGVLKGIDFGKITIDYVLYEDNYPENGRSCRDLLRKNGYVFVTEIGGDFLYKREDLN